MVKKSVWAVCSVALLAAAFALPASAQDVQDRGPIVAHATSMHAVNGVEPNVPPAPPIFSNLGTYNANTCPGTEYVGCAWEPTGYYVAGPTSAIATTQNIAEPFTPRVAATMHHVEIPVQTAGGTTVSFTASVQTDAAGVPSGVYGALPTHRHVVAGVSTFWTCCGTGVGGGVVVPLTLALNAGTQYWIVADCNAAADTATLDVWDATGVHSLDASCIGTSPCTTYGFGIQNLNAAMKVY